MSLTIGYGPVVSAASKAGPGGQREVNAEPRPGGSPGAEHDRRDQPGAAEPRGQAGGGGAAVGAIRPAASPCAGSVHRLTRTGMNVTTGMSETAAARSRPARGATGALPAGAVRAAGAAPA